MDPRTQLQGLDAPQTTPGRPESNALGNRVFEKDPRGRNQENETIPTNIFGERPWVRNEFIRGDNPNQGPDRLPERGPFGVLAEGQTHDRNLILGENTMGHHVGASLPQGAGAMDEAAKAALGLGIYGITPMHTPEKMRRDRFHVLLIAHEQFARNVQQNLLELYALDPNYFDTHYAHLRKTDMPLPVKDFSHPGFTTFEAMLHQSRGLHPRTPVTVSRLHPDHPEYAPPDDLKRLRHYYMGGWVDIPREMYEHYGVTAEQVKDATRDANARVEQLRLTGKDRMMLLEEAHALALRPVPAAMPDAEPKPWKESK